MRTWVPHMRMFMLLRAISMWQKSRNNFRLLLMKIYLIMLLLLSMRLPIMLLKMLLLL